MRIVIFGATGRTGRLLVSRALHLGHDVVAFARDPTRIELGHDRLHFAKGDVLDAASVDRAVEGTEAVLSALGTDAFRPRPVLSQGVRHVLDAMEVHRVRRVVVLSAAGALGERAGFLAGTVGLRLARIVLWGVYREHRRMLEELARRNLDWVAVRAVFLTNGPPTARYRVVTEGIPRWGFRISRADVASFMIQQLTSDTFVRKMPTIAN